MNARMNVNGKWVDVEFLYPHQEEPIKVFLPLGVVSHQPHPYNTCNAKIEMPFRGPIVAPGEYEIQASMKSYRFRVERSQYPNLWGNVI